MWKRIVNEKIIPELLDSFFPGPIEDGNRVGNYADDSFRPSVPPGDYLF